MRIYIKGDYTKEISFDYLELARRMWFDTKDGKTVDISYFGNTRPFKTDPTSMEYPWKMWFKERKGVEVCFSYARDDDFYFSVSLDKFSSNDERWGMADFRVGNDPWATFKREMLLIMLKGIPLLLLLLRKNSLFYKC